MPGSQDDLSRTMSRLVKAIERQNQRIERSGGGARAAAGAGLLARGGVASTVAGMGMLGGAGGGLAGLAMQAGEIAGRTAFEVGGAGFVSAARGGTFAGGAVSGAAKLMADIPIFGEWSGMARTVRGQEGALADLNRWTDEHARFAGKRGLTPEVREFHARRAVEQNRNIQASREANRRLVEGMIGEQAKGTGEAERIIAALERLANTLEKFAFGGSGGADALFGIWGS